MNTINSFKTQLREYFLNFDLDYFNRPVVVEYSLDGVELVYSYKDKILKEQFLEAFKEVRDDIVFNDVPNRYEKMLQKGDIHATGMEDAHVEFINEINAIVIDWNAVSFWDSNFEDYLEWWKQVFK